jgi:hypothetical protein
MAKRVAGRREPYAVVLTDRAHSRLFLVKRGKAKEVSHAQADVKQVRHIKTAGTDHTNSSSRFQRKADNRVRMNLRSVIGRMEQLAGAGPLKMILAGTSRITAELRRLLPAHLASSVVGEVTMPMTASEERVVELAEPIAEAISKPATPRKR